MSFRILFCISLFMMLCFSHWNFAEDSTIEQERGLIFLKGYLGKDELSKVRQLIGQFEKENYHTLVLSVDSSVGNLQDVLELAKQIYDWKQEKSVKIIVYIEDNAVGPAAILPFLADELIISHIVSWGDIPLGSENIVATNILRNRVLSLISSKNSHMQLLSILAEGMSDPSVEIIDDSGQWKIAKTSEAHAFSAITTKGQPLVINHLQMQELGLVSAVMSVAKFHQTFQPTKEQTEQEKKLSLSQPDSESRKSIEERLRSHIHYSENSSNSVGYIVIEDHEASITQATWLYVKSALEHYKKTKPIFVILDLNTPGGEVFAAQKISDALKELDTQYNIPVVAFINNWAISAGAMLAYSSRFITIVKDASMGAAEPIVSSSMEGKTETASEKVNSALRADFANRAQFFGRNPYIAEAMVDKDVILVLRNGKIIKLDTDAQIRVKGSDPDIVISPKGKLLTLNAEQMMDYGVADIMAPPEKLELISDQEREAGKWPASKSLLFQTSFFKQIPHATIDAFQMDWKTKFFAFLSKPLVSSLLFLGMMIGFYIEINTPGFGIAGTVAVTCLIFILLSSFSLQLVNWLELIMLISGMIIVLFELLILPTFGILGFVGILLLLGGLFGMMLPGLDSVSFDVDSKTLNAAGQVVVERLTWLCGTLAVGIIIIIAMAKYVMPNVNLFRRFVLIGEQEASLGYIAGENPATLPQPGSKGIVLATLRPSGKVLIQDVAYDAVSQGGFIEKDTPIVVLRLDGSKIVVTLRDVNESSSSERA